MIYEEIMEYMPISGQNAVPDCVWTSSPNSFLHHAWNHALNTSTSNHQADRIVFGLPLCSSHTHCPSCQGVAGTDCPGMSLQHPHHRPKNGPDYSGPGEAQSQCCQGEFGWCMRRSVFCQRRRQTPIDQTKSLEATWWNEVQIRTGTLRDTLSGLGGGE